MENAKSNIEFIEKRVKVSLFCYFLVIVFSQQLEGAKITYGHKLERTTFKILWGLSLNDCHKECVRRRTCRSFNYLRLTKVCELNKADKFDIPNDYIGQAKYMYGQKIDWGIPDFKQECDSCGDDEVCESSENGTPYCTVSECQSELPVHGGTEVLGNVQNIGATIKYTCIGGTLMVGNPVSLCNHTGSWTSPDFKCVPAQCLTPNIDSHYEVINVSINWTSVQMHFRCSGNYLTRGSPLVCDNDGEYSFQRVCCVTPDQNHWVNIFSIRTMGGNLPKAMWSQSDYRVLSNRNTSINCEFRRYDIISNWSSLNISKIKVQFLVGSSIGASVIFDGFGSTNIDWLSKSRLITSTWQDLSPDTYVWNFKLLGFSTTDAVSVVRFTIIETFPEYDTCTEMSGWMMVGSTPCLNVQEYPLVLFARGSTKAENASEFAIADSMEVLIETLSEVSLP